MTKESKNHPPKKGLFGWFGKKTSATDDTLVEDVHSEIEIDGQDQNVAVEETQSKPTLLKRLRQGLSKSRAQLGEGLANIFMGRKKIDEDLFEDIETQLLLADIGMDTTQKIISQLTESVSRAQLKDSGALFEVLKKIMAELLKPVQQPLVIDDTCKPFVILMVGVNGVGKTTTIGKLAKKFQAQGKKVMLAAGDTFRAAAVEQLQVWGERNQVPVVAQQTGADSASVIYDALQSATAKGVDVLIADTAGRLQNKAHLMQELEKVIRVMKKLDPDAPHETLLVVDAGTGQNAINQTGLFHEAVGLSGLALSKLDGTAKGGILYALADKYQIPLRFIGVGEGIDDLREFNAEDFSQAIFEQQQ